MWHVSCVTVLKVERTMPRKNIAVLVLMSVTLSGCSTLQKLNPFKHKAVTAPCEAIASIESVTTTCEGKEINIDVPPLEELYKLRGPIDINTGRAVGLIQLAP